MQKLVVRNQGYQYMEKAFGEWLDVLGYGSGTVKGMPVMIREFLYFLENNGVTQIGQLQQYHIKDYHSYISRRGNERRGGGLSNNYINKHLQAVSKFLEYLHHRGVEHLPSSGISMEKLYKKEMTVLTQEEIRELFALTQREVNTEKEQMIQSRDRAMLVIYYSCGLRRNEGINVSVDDIDFDRGMVHVRKGKNYKERFVPLNKANVMYLQEWVYDYRMGVVKTKKEHRLFIGVNGEAMSGGALYTRLKLLQQQSDNLALREKTIGLHTLRHSIATHLLQAGMGLEKIARFLGHSTMDSTQIYTHLI